MVRPVRFMSQQDNRFGRRDPAQCQTEIGFSLKNVIHSCEPKPFPFALDGDATVLQNRNRAGLQDIDDMGGIRVQVMVAKRRQDAGMLAYLAQQLSARLNRSRSRIRSPAAMLHGRCDEIPRQHYQIRLQTIDDFDCFAQRNDREVVIEIEDRSIARSEIHHRIQSGERGGTIETSRGRFASKIVPSPIIAMAAIAAPVVLSRKNLRRVGNNDKPSYASLQFADALSRDPTTRVLQTTIEPPRAVGFARTRLRRCSCLMDTSASFEPQESTIPGTLGRLRDWLALCGTIRQFGSDLLRDRPSACSQDIVPLAKCQQASA